MKRIGKLLSVLLAVSLIVCTAVLTLSATAALSATISGYKVTRTGSQEAVDFTPDTVLHRGDSFEALVTVQSNLSSGTYGGSVTLSFDKAVLAIDTAKYTVGTPTSIDYSYGVSIVERPNAGWIAERESNTDSSFSVGVTDPDLTLLPSGSSVSFKIAFRVLSDATFGATELKITDSEFIKGGDASSVKCQAATASFTVDKAEGPDAIAAPEVSSKTDAKVILAATENAEYGYKLSSAADYTWQASNEFTGLSANTGYDFVQRIKETADTKCGSTSQSTAVTTDKHAAPSAPAAPVSTETAAEKVTLTSVAGCEYGYKLSTATEYTWQASNIITGLSPNKSYDFVQRIKETSDTYVSAASEKLTLTTPKRPAPAVPSKPVSDETLDVKVTLHPTSGYEYGCKKPGETDYTWQDSNVFSSLTSNTSYSFVQRVKETDEQLGTAASEALVLTTALEVPATPSAPTYDAAKTTDSKIVLNAATGCEYGYKKASDISYTWVSGTELSGLDVYTEYEIVQRVAATASSSVSGASQSIKVRTLKHTAPAAPSALSEEAKTNNSVTFTALADTYEYGYKLNGSANEYTWQASNVIEGLSPNKKYDFVARVKETSDTYAGEISAVTNVTTNKNPAPETPAVPAAISDNIGDRSITLTVVAGAVYKCGDGEWQTGNVFTNLSPNTEYTFYQKIAETETTYESAVSAGAVIKTAKSSVSAPSAPVLSENGKTEVTLIANALYEYSMDGTTWSDSNVFSSLTVGTTYSFYQRIKETETAKASPASQALTVTTLKNEGPAATLVPKKNFVSETVVRLTPEDGYEYSIDGKTWSDDPLFTKLKPFTTYTFYQRVKETGTAYAGEISYAKIKTSCDHSQITVKVTSEPTCTENGKSYNVCSVCDTYVKENVLPAKGHSFGDWVVTAKATETSDRVEERVCSVCGEKETRTSKCEHTSVSEKIISEPTCVEAGVTKHICDECGFTVKTDTVPAKGHTPGEWETTKEATSSDDGEKVRKCTVCGEILEKETIPAVKVPETTTTTTETTTTGKEPGKDGDNTKTIVIVAIAAVAVIGLGTGITVAVSKSKKKK